MSANWALAQDDDSAEHRERVDKALDVLAYYVASELLAAMRMCHYLHQGSIVTSPALHRYYSQAKDIARWLGSASFRLGQLGHKCSLAGKTSDWSSAKIPVG